MGGTSNRQWLTPDVLGADTSCVRFSFPTSVIEQVRGALLLLTDADNWEEVGTITPDEVSERLFASWLAMNEQGSACMIGAVLPYLSVDPPSGCLVCDGTSYHMDDYPLLYAAIDPAYKSGEYFTVPDLSDRFLIGEATGKPTGSTGGEATHTLTVAEMPLHAHSESIAVATVINGGLEAPASAAIPSAAATGATGGGGAHNNLPPFHAVRYCVVAT